MSTNETDKTPAIQAVPLLQSLGDADAAVCTDGSCAVPTAPATAGADQ